MNVLASDDKSLATIKQRIKAAITALRSESFILIDLKQIHAVVHPEHAEQLANNCDEFLPQLNRTAQGYNNVG